MNALKTGALAITLIICIPILLGFGMATQTVETTVNTESADRSLTDLILNSESDYYIDYTGPANNSQIIQEVYAQGGVNRLSVAPDYVSTSSKYTSLPTFTSGTSTFSLNAGSTDTISGSSRESVIVGSTTTGDNVFNNDLVCVTNTDSVLVQIIYYTEDDWFSTYTNSNESYYLYRSGTDSDGSPMYTLEMPDSTEVRNVTSFEMLSNQSPTFTVYHRETTPVNIDYSFYSMSADSHAIIYIDSTREFIEVSDLDSLVYSYGHLFVNDVYYDSASSYQICLPPGYDELTYTYNTIVSDSYADPSLGWGLPEYTASTYTGYYDYWTNGMVNDSVTFDLVFTAYGTAIFEIVDGLGESAVRTVTLTYSSDGTSATVSGEDGGTADLGSYSHVRLVLSSDSVTVSGIKEWTYIGGDPEIYNSVSWDTENGTFTYVRLTPISTTAHFRVSEASVLAGTFPSTYNRHFELYSYYPDDDMQSIRIDTVGVYGDYLTIGGVARTVTDGKIPIGDGTVSVLGMVVKYVYDSDSDTYTTYVNDYLLSQSSSTPELIFGGEWVLTLHRIAYSEETVVSEDWQPGEFAFDEDDFILAMIITSVGVFVALGLMKGVRVGVLLVVCSAAGIIAFIIA